MKRLRFTEAQIALILRQAEEGTAVGEVCREAGIGQGCRWSCDARGRVTRGVSG